MVKSFFGAGKTFESIIAPKTVTISFALLHAKSVDYLRDDIKHGISNVIRRNISIDFPRRMNVERSIKFQHSLAEAYQNPIKTLNDLMSGGIYSEQGACQSTRIKMKWQ